MAADPNHAGAHSGRAQLLCIAAGCAVGFATGWNAANVGAVAPALAHDYGTSMAVIGLFTGGFYLAHSALQIPAGHVSDRVGPRSTALVGLVLVVLFNAVALLAPQARLAISARIGVGVGTALGFIGALEYIRASATPVALGVFGGVATAAGAVALALVPQLETLVGWRAPFASSCLIALVALALMAAALPTRRSSPGRTRQAPVRSFVRDRRLLAIGVVYAGTLGLSVVAANWIVSLLVQAGEATNGVAGGVASLSLLTGILTRPLGGWAVGRGQRATRILVVVSVAAGVGGMLALATARPLALAVAGSAVVGLAAGFPFAPMLAAAGRARPEATGAAIGFVNTLYALTVLIGVPLLGLSFSLPGGGRAGFVVLAVLWGGCLLALPVALAEASPRAAAKSGDADPAVSEYL
jgi:MFS family permease